MHIYQLITSKGNFQVRANNEKDAIVNFMRENPKAQIALVNRIEVAILNLTYEQVKLLQSKRFSLNEIRSIDAAIEVLGLIHAR